MPDSDMVTYATLTPANGQSPYVNGVSNTNEQNHNATNMIPNNNCSTQGKANGKRSGGASAQTAQKSYQTVNGKSNGQNSNNMTKPSPGGGKKTKGRVKIKMEFIDNKLRRYTTFSKRKTGIMKKVTLQFVQISKRFLSFFLCFCHIMLSV